ncbi:venom acid phosphatase Acph-1 isoform X1 [Halictus rubicundus]|uniref:venom acid phosphatase Acph-1 isoform X1 n=2 Tax=Halictus rubicundus TaxID=77578 RepID=UPI004036E31C
MKASIFCSLCILITSVKAKPELQLLQIVFAHKTYAPISTMINSYNTSFPARLTYDHFNFAPIDMPNTGKLNMYNLGAHFRDVYDEFLGKLYRVEIMKMRTAEYPLSMLSAQLVNAGLWPPEELNKWSDDINWQPVPADYAVAEKDTLFLGSNCPSFASDMQTVLTSNEVKSRMLHHTPLLDHVSNYTGVEMQHPSDIALLYAVLETKATLNESLPYWAKDIFPDGDMYNVTLLEYDLLSQTPLQMKLNGGTFIKEILANTLEYIDGVISKQRKLMMYSGNDRNIAGILKALDLWSPHIPSEAASVIFETYYDNETEHYGMKVNYYTGVEGETIPLTIPGCTEICPLDRFINAVFDLLPENSAQLCHWRSVNISDEEILLNDVIYNRSESQKLYSVLFIVSFLSISLVY